MKDSNPQDNTPEEEKKEEQITFDDLGFNYDLLDGLDSMGFINATPVQAAAIPSILDGKDVMAIAQTGTGKTAAFLLPVLNMIMEEKYNGKSSCLIVSPTRELAKQIDLQAEALGYFTGVSSVAVYGGGEGGTWDQQKKALTSGADIIAATPGRLIAHINLGYVDFSSIKYFILDEADRMLDMGFSNDIETISNKMPKTRQTLMFSATMPQNIRKLSSKLLNNPTSINIAISKPAKNVLQVAYNVYDNQKISLITELLKGKKSYKKIIIFSSSKKAVSSIVLSLKKAGLKAQGVSSDLVQKARENALKDFANGTIPIVVATDVLSRGIDIKDINLVINYDVPPDPEDYIHRIGRTARANTTGVGITLITEKDQFRFSKIEKLLGEEIRKSPLPESLGKGPKYDPSANRHSYSKGKGGYKKKVIMVKNHLREGDNPSVDLKNQFLMTKRKEYHIIIDYQFRQLEKNQATLEEELILSKEYGIQSCEYEKWVNETVALSFTARIEDTEAKIQAVKHLIKMIIRKHSKRQNIKITNISVDAENQNEFYSEHIQSILQ